MGIFILHFMDVKRNTAIKALRKDKNMCTAITYHSGDFYFGRTLDHEVSFGEQVVITPRNYPFSFLNHGKISSHYAIIGMACVVNNYPLYYEATNEAGLAMAGLNFVGNAFYSPKGEGVYNLAQYEFIPWVLGRCKDLNQAKKEIAQICLVDTPFSSDMPATQLHWIVADGNGAIVVEYTQTGLHIYDNPAGVLANNPPFPLQMFSLNNYMHLSPKSPDNTFAPELPLQEYCKGMGAIGLPGDWSSQSRFVRAAYVVANSTPADTEEARVNQFFHMINTVDQVKGCTDLGNGKYEMTLYASCCNTDKGIYYYTTYGNHQITAVDMKSEDLEQKTLICYPLQQTENILFANK